MGFYGYKKPPTAAQQQAKVDKAKAKLMKKADDLQPIIIEGWIIAKSWWGKAWNLNLESYADYHNRIARGSSYVRNGAILDLKITTGLVVAQVIGSTTEPYQIKIVIDPLSETKWEQVIELCDHQIDSLEQLMEGKFPKSLEQIFTGRQYGLFPSPPEIHFSCSCPDVASMCKHVAAALYGVGARLDHDPMLFFSLRAVDGQGLIKNTIDRKVESMLINANQPSERTISDQEMHDLFGL